MYSSRLILILCVMAGVLFTAGNSHAYLFDYQQPQLVMEVTGLRLDLNEAEQQLTVTATGKVPTAGWTGARLVPYMYFQFPADGIYDYSFVATPLRGMAAQVITSITAQLILNPVPADLKGVRVHAQANAMTQMLDRQTAAYFQFADSHNDLFIIKLSSPDLIQHARDVIAGIEKEQVHVSGTIVKNWVPYNPAWSYYLDSDSINFFQMAVEVCDSSIRYVEERLNEVGGSFLPGNYWCPWSSHLIREVQAEESGLLWKE